MTKLKFCVSRCCLVGAISSSGPTIAKSHITFATDYSFPLIINVFISWPGFPTATKKKKVGLSPCFSHSSGVWTHFGEALSKGAGTGIRRCRKGKPLPPPEAPLWFTSSGKPSWDPYEAWMSCFCSLSALRSNMQRTGVLEPHSPSWGPRANICSSVTLGQVPESLTVSSLKQRG